MGYRAVATRVKARVPNSGLLVVAPKSAAESSYRAGKTANGASRTCRPPHLTSAYGL